MYLWGKTIQVLRFVIARMAQDAFLCWTLDQNALYGSSRLRATSDIVAAVRDSSGANRPAPDFRDGILAWLWHRGWATGAIVVLIYILVFGVVGAMVGGLFGTLWGLSEWGKADERQTPLTQVLFARAEFMLYNPDTDCYAGGSHGQRALG